MHYLAFDKNWFLKHQSKLIWLLNHKLTKRLFRHILRIENKETINRIEPNAYWFGAKKKGKQIEVKADFRTHDKYSKRLYFAFSPLWWVMHFLDWLFIDKFIPKFSFGFDTLTAYPNAGDPGTTTVDGNIVSRLSTWASTIAATSGNADLNTITATNFISNRKIAADDWICTRGFFLFDTSSLTSTASISAAVFSPCANGDAETNTDSISIGVFSATPASNTTLVGGDFDQVGSTAFATMLLGSWVQTDGNYNDFNLDANGIANISKTGVSKFSTRGSLDYNGSPDPTGNNSVACYYADSAGTSQDPKLVVTYTIASAKHFALLGVG